MKRIKSIITMIILVIATSANATIYVVDNNPSHPTPYQDINAAISAASNGDTIYVQGSGSSYPYFTLDKQLVIIGTGINPQKQNPVVATVEQFALAAGSSGSSILGLNLHCYQCGNELIEFPDGNIDNISLIGCGLSTSSQNEKAHVRGNNWLLRNNIIGWTLWFDTTITNFNCENNVFVVGGFNANGVSNLSGPNCVIKNNIFLNNSFSQSIFDAGKPPQGVLVENNIFFGADPSHCPSCTFNNNISYLCNNPTLPPPGATGANNLSGTDPLFINFPVTGAYGFYGYDCHLQLVSPGHNAGTDGTDIGVYGGSSPFNYGTEPSIPQIKSLDIYNTTVPAGGMLQFNAVSKK